MTFKEILLHHYKFTEEECDITFGYFKPEFYEAKQMFLEEGKISDKIAVVMSGLFRSYFYDDNAGVPGNVLYDDCVSRLFLTQ